MLRAIGRTVLEIARAIDTGHAIRHGVTLTRSERATLRRSVGDSARGPQANSSERLESAGCLRPLPAHEDPRSTSVNQGDSAVRMWGRGEIGRKCRMCGGT